MTNRRMLLQLIIVGTIAANIGCFLLGFDKEAQGNQIVTKIEAFRSKEHRLPTSLGEIEIPEKEEGPIYYRQVDDDTYELWFGTTLGESRTYNSDNKTWK